MRLRRLLFRWVIRPLLIVGLPLAVILGGIWAWLATSLPQTSGSIAFDGIRQPVEIVRDGDGVPHIFAQSDADGYFALGFVHAQDRLWQMEQLRRAATGRIAEIAGEAAVPFDRLIRTLGLERLAQAQLAQLDPVLRADLDAYTAGVNAYIANHRGAWPPEFILLGIAPEPWKPVDSLVWGQLMALQLSGNWRDEMLRAQLLKIMSPEQVDQLWPPVPGAAPQRATESAPVGGLPLAALARLFATVDGHGASSEWVVDGAHSATGKPILANDPHLGFSLPILWYLATVETPTLHLAGATVPGVPLTILGHNDRIAWGLTTTGGDVEDLFVEKLDPNDPNRYLTPDGSVPFRSRVETITVKGKPAVSIAVRETRHGPVISDAVEEFGKVLERGTVMVLAATWLDPTNRVTEAIYGIDRAKDWDSFTAALKDFNAPEQNVAYADKDGHIGYYVAGWLPIRKSGNGRVPVPGWSGDYDWIGKVPFAELPHALDPPTGRFVNANDRVAPAGYPYLIATDGYDWPYRARRIEELLATRPQHDLDSFGAIQGDIVSPAARELLPLMTAIAPQNPASVAMLERLKAWNGAMDRTRPEPLVFDAWLRELNRGLFADRQGTELFPQFWGLRPGLILSVLTERQAWCAKVDVPPQPGDCKVKIGEAFARAMAWLSERYGRDPSLWRWGDAHQAQFIDRVFSGIPGLDRLVNLRLPADGGEFTLNRAGFAVANERAPFTDVHGAGYRAIYDLADLTRSRFMIATGESGNPLSPHFTDLVLRWRDTDYLTLSSDRVGLIKGGGAVLTLAPK